MENPALGLRKKAKAVLPRGMLRWDISGRALLVSDAPRHGDASAGMDALRADGYAVAVENDLLWMDLPEDAYAALIGQFFCMPGDWTEDWFAEQALLAGILTKEERAGGLADVPLLRAALVACGRGEVSLRAFVARLRAEDAQGLREGNTASCRACAALCAHWLWTQRGIGLPEMVAWRGEM